MAKVRKRKTVHRLIANSLATAAPEIGIIPASLPSMRVTKRKPKGNKASIAPEEIERGKAILRSMARMSYDAARTELRERGIKRSNGEPASDSALNRLIIAPAYAQE